MPASAAAAVSRNPLVTHVHSAVLVSSYILIFPALVSDPVPALLSTLPLVAGLQAIHAILCLPLPPASPSPTSPSTPAKSPANKPRRTPSSNTPPPPPPLATRVLSAVLSLFLTGSAGVAVLFALLVAMGAPITTHLLHTALTAAHMALLAVFPLVYRIGVDATRWRTAIAVQAELDPAFGGAVGACVGAWLGAIPIPLDWDREWQKWPVTIVTGAYAGYVLGKSLGTVFERKKFPL